MAQAGLNIGQAMADVAAIAILQHRAAQDAQVLNDQLNHALNTRILIEQAKGMVAERRRMTCTKPSPACVATPAPTTCAWPTSPATSPKVDSTRRCCHEPDPVRLRQTG